MTYRWAVVIACALGPMGCTGAGLRYAGDRRPVAVQPELVAIDGSVVVGYERLGRVSAECSGVEPSGGLRGARLSDVACSRELLLGAFREHAASVGGTLLRAVECDPPDGGELQDGDLSCEAEVWGPARQHVSAGRARSSLGSAARPAPTPPLGSARDAWRVRIDYWPQPGLAARSAVAPSSVAELAFPRAGEAAIGELRSRCDDGCSLASVREALRAAAARVGATALVEVRCLGAAGSPQCLAQVAAPETEVRRVAEAR